MIRTVKVGVKNPLTDKYLLILRDKKFSIPNPDMWDALGGGIEADETPLAAAKRESSEETGGILIYDFYLLGTASINEKVIGKESVTELWMYLAKTKAPIESIKVSEGQKAGYFSLDEIVRLNTAPELKRFAEAYKDELKKF